MKAQIATLRDPDALIALFLSAVLVATVSLAARLMLKDRFVADAESPPVSQEVMEGTMDN